MLVLTLLMICAGASLGPPAACQSATHSCLEQGASGCDDVACCAAVCAIDPSCCSSSWDSGCVQLAINTCAFPPLPFECAGRLPPHVIAEAEPCGASTNPGCNGPSKSGSSCCVPGYLPWCDDPDCMDAVCAIDPYCCMVAWDQFCVDEAIVFCPDLCAISDPLVTTIELGTVVCGTTWRASDVARDFDWYALHLTAITEVVITLTSQLAMKIGIGDADGAADCSAAIELDPFTTTAPAVPTTLTACLEPGTHWIVLRSASYWEIDCDSDAGAYVLEVAMGAPRCTLPDPVNEVCADALDIFEGATPVSTHDAATDGPLLPVPCSPHAPTGSMMERDVWFRHQASRDGTLRMTTCGTCTFAARLAVYTGSCESLEFIDCDTYTSTCVFYAPQLDIDVTQGETYYLRLGSSGYSDGTATLSLSYLGCAPAYALDVIVPPAPDTMSIATNLSNDGEVIGGFGTASSALKPFRWSSRAGLQPLSASTSHVAIDVNTAGLAVGIGSGAQPVTFMLNGFPASLPLLPLCSTGAAVAVNDAGTILGKFTTAQCATPVVTWNGGPAAPLGVPPEAKQPTSLSELGAAAGWGSTGFGPGAIKGWLFADGTFQWIESGDADVGVQILGMNDANVLVGRHVFQEGHHDQTFAPLVWTAGAIQALPLAPGYVSGRAADINNEGTIAGTFDGPQTSFKQFAPFVLRPGGTPRHLNDLMGAGTGYVMRDIVAINETGQIAGEARPVDDLSSSPVRYAVRLTPVTPTGDLNCDGIVDGIDLSTLLGSWGPCQTNLSCNADFTLDGTIDAADLAVVLGGWGVATTR